MSTDILTSEQLAAKWQVPERWIRDAVRGRRPDPPPHYRLGRYVRFKDDAELEKWFERQKAKR